MLRSPPFPNIVIGQRVDPAKVLRAKELRRRMTPAERRLWNCLRANRLGGRQFRRQQVIDGYIVDFYCHAAVVVVEVDGPVHEDQAEYDAERDRILTARGLRVSGPSTAERRSGRLRSQPINSFLML